MVKFYLINNRNKKAQAWSLDALVSIVIFMAAISILFFYATNYAGQISSPLDDLTNQGNTASSLILSNNEIGILNNDVISQSKLTDFYNANYQTKKSQLGIKDNFYFNMTDLEANSTSQPYIGLTPTGSVENFIKIERITVYKNKIAKLELFIWR